MAKKENKDIELIEIDGELIPISALEELSDGKGSEDHDEK